ncbi:KinB-signaling pathway activation protein [Heyndrickxia acidiproducens]|uniref:KinB-signaling pathway activation protein n=1 Tax=Heyndrickxia acidiproducens TaxID=1121084 RepID=UPI00035D6282|nr:KinB-signaling pathway activation protein [Heyndrickxia acidiproducens]
MTSRNMVRFFFATLGVGGLSTGILGFMIRWQEMAPYFIHVDIQSIFGAFLWFTGMGFIFSLVSQVGYFAYLFVHQLGLDIFRSRTVWGAIQFVAACYILFDFVYFRAEAFSVHFNQSLLLAGIILLAALVVAFAKVKQTKTGSTFIPAVFFMVAATILEWVPALRVNKEVWLYLMVFPLILCNAFQLLVLPYFLKRSQKEREEKAAVRKMAARGQKTGN